MDTLIVIGIIIAVILYGILKETINNGDEAYNRAIRERNEALIRKQENEGYYDESRFVEAAKEKETFL